MPIVQNYFVLTEAERTTALTLDDDSNAVLGERAIDNASPGVGINLNDNATNYAPGDPVTLTGTYVAAKRIVDNPDYQNYCPALITFLLTLPFASLENETIFAPIEQV